MTFKLEIVTCYKGFASAGEALQALIGARPELASFSARPIGKKTWVPLDRHMRSLTTSAKPTVHLQTPCEGSISFRDIANHRLALFWLDRVAGDEESASNWISALMCDQRFVHAHLLDEEYNFWQNARDPLQYTTRGRSVEGLPMIHNGLPPPLARMDIDTSRNPGRRVLREGFIEAVGSPMWLSPRFFALTGARIEDLRLIQGIELASLDAGVIRVRRSAGPFTRGDGSEGALQDELRRALFPRGAAGT